MGPARALEDTCIGDDFIKEDEIIDAPNNAVTVSIDKMKVKKIVIVDKKPNTFKKGYWDIDIKYVFVYRITFREADGCKIGSIKAYSVYHKRVTMFGSEGQDLTIGTDLFDAFGNGGTTLEGDPYVLVEAKAIALSAELRFCKPKHHCKPCHHNEPGGDVGGLFGEPNEVLVTIGLFSIIKIFRIVNLTVQSHGFCIPEEGEEISPLNPCDFFDNLDFPLDIFCPPQKPEFFAGVSNNLKPEKCDKKHKHGHHHGHCKKHCEPDYCKPDFCEEKEVCHPKNDPCECEYPSHKKGKKGYYK